VKLCTVCGVVTSRAGSRCAAHARRSSPSRHSGIYRTRAWQRLSARVLRAWRGERGDWCPGYRRPAHRASDLTVDHVVPLAAGGAPYDIANTAVLCRSCNSSKGASTEGGGDRHGRRGLRTAPTQERTLPMPLVVAWRLLTERRAA
jgi:5-methylcytosine-specific restriction protein A